MEVCMAGGIGGTGGNGGAPGHINVYAPAEMLQLIGVQPFTVFDDGGAGGAPGSPGKAAMMMCYCCQSFSQHAATSYRNCNTVLMYTGSVQQCPRSPASLQSKQSTSAPEKVAAR